MPLKYGITRVFRSLSGIADGARLVLARRYARSPAGAVTRVAKYFGNG